MPVKPAKVPQRSTARPPVAELPSDERVAAIAKALAHPARVRIVRLLLEKETCIGCDIVDEVGLAQSTVSEHLRILKAAGVVAGEIERPRVCYFLNPDCLDPLAQLLNLVAGKAASGALCGPDCTPPERAAPGTTVPSHARRGS